MRTSIIDGLNAAVRSGLIPAATDVQAVAAKILDAFVDDGSPVIGELSVLPESTPVLALSAPEMVAVIASQSAERASADGEPHITRTVAGPADLLSFRHLGWRLSRVFGVKAFTGNGQTAWLVAGRSSDINGWLNALDTLHMAGQAEASKLSDDDRVVFWSSVGATIVDTERAAEQIAAARDHYLGAKSVAEHTFGAPARVQLPEPAEDGTSIAQAVKRTLAAAALG